MHLRTQSSDEETRRRNPWVARYAARYARLLRTATSTDQHSSNSVIVDSHMSPSEIVSLLVSWGCSNLTSRLDSASHSEYPVGSGGFGDVHSGFLDNGTQVAIKAIRPLSADGLTAGKYQKRAAKELYAWSKCQHRNVARLLGFSEFRGRLAMISEWAENGNITAYLARNRSADRCSLSLDVCRGLAYLHSQNIVHGDLKGVIHFLFTYRTERPDEILQANVLVSSQGYAMLTDFGNAKLAESAVSFTTTANTSFSIRWTAPEILRGSSPVSQAGDIYALGMTILEIIAGQVPFHQVPDWRIYVVVVNLGQSLARPEDKIPAQSVCGDLLWTLLERCWTRQPRLRPSAEQVKNIMMGITQEGLLYIEPEPESEDKL